MNFLLIKSRGNLKSRLFVAIVRFFFSEVIFKWSDFKGGRKINLEITLFMEKEREGEREKRQMRNSSRENFHIETIKRRAILL